MNVDSPKLFAGIDGGGTKTEAVIADEQGRIIGHGLAGGSNPHNVPLEIGFTHIHQALTAAANQASATHRVDLHRFTSICAGIAGLDTQEEKRQLAHYLQNFPTGHRPFHSQHYTICNDGYIGLQTVAGSPYGICLIASTGSNCYGLNSEGEEAKAGDWGYLLGDQGSAYVLGLKILQQVMKESDGRQPVTLLTQTVLKHLRLSDQASLFSWAYNSQPPIKDIASLSKIVVDPQLTDSTFLQVCIRETQEALIEAYQAVVNRLKLSDHTFPVALVGGLFKLPPSFADSIKAAILAITPHAQPEIAAVTPAAAAVKIAQADPSLLPRNVLNLSTQL